MHITDQIGYSFLKILVFMIFFISYGFCILVFFCFVEILLFRRVADIQILIKTDDKSTQNLRIFLIVKKQTKNHRVRFSLNITKTKSIKQI